MSSKPPKSHSSQKETSPSQQKPRAAPVVRSAADVVNRISSHLHKLNVGDHSPADATAAASSSSQQRVASKTSSDMGKNGRGSSGFRRTAKLPSPLLVSPSATAGFEGRAPDEASGGGTTRSDMSPSPSGSPLLKENQMMTFDGALQQQQKQSSSHSLFDDLPHTLSRVVSNRGEYIRHQKLGEGAFGSTWLVEWRPSNQHQKQVSPSKTGSRSPSRTSSFSRSKITTPRAKRFSPAPDSCAAPTSVAEAENRRSSSPQQQQQQQEPQQPKQSPPQSPRSTESSHAPKGSASFSGGAGGGGTPPVLSEEVEKKIAQLPPARVSALSCCRPLVDVKGSSYKIPFSSAFVLKVELKKSGAASAPKPSDAGARSFASCSRLLLPGGGGRNTTTTATVVLTPQAHNLSPNAGTSPAQEAERQAQLADMVERMQRSGDSRSKSRSGGGSGGSSGSMRGSSRSSRGLGSEGSSVSGSSEGCDSAMGSFRSSTKSSAVPQVPEQQLLSMLGSNPLQRLPVGGAASGKPSFGSNSDLHSLQNASSSSVASASAGSSKNSSSDFLQRHGGVRLLERAAVRDALFEHVHGVRESLILRNCAHPNIVGFVDQFEDETNNYLVMEYVDGGDVREEVLRRQKELFGGTGGGSNFSGPGISVPSALFLWVQAVCAVEYLHRHNIVHRDLKTANLLCSRKWRVLLADFGFGQDYSALGCDIDQATATMTAKGTPHYMAPELFVREGSSGKADVWALGVILYELLTLTRPFERGGAEDDIEMVASRIVYEQPPQVEELRGEPVNPELQKLLDMMLAKDPDTRPTAKQILNVPIVSAALDDYVAKFTRAARSSTEDVDKVLCDTLCEHVAVVRGDRLSGAASRRSQAARMRLESQSAMMTRSTASRNPSTVGGAEDARSRCEKSGEKQDDDEPPQLRQMTSPQLM